MVEMNNFEQAVDQVITDSERLHKIVNGTSVDTIQVEDGSFVPSVRKAMQDNLYFKTPALPWLPGTVATVFNQLYAYRSIIGVQWWYAPGATAASPIALPADPTNNVNWRLYLDGATMASLYATLDSPVFRGNPQTPTPPTASNSLTIANTAFVKAAIAAALSGFTGAPVVMQALTVTGATTLNTLAVTGAASFASGVTLGSTLTGDNTNARFENITLTKELSSLSFAFSNPLTPNFMRSRITPYTIQTHTLTSDQIVNGVESSDNTTMAMRGIGNSLFDYVYIRGNTQKPATTPRLTVDGVTRLQNLEITGTVSGLTMSVDGQVVRPESVITTQEVTVGTTLTVNGLSDLQAVNAQSVNIASTLNVTGLSTLSGGFNTGNGNGVIGGSLSVTGASNLTGNVTVVGETNLQSTLSVSGLISALAGLNVTGDIYGSSDLTLMGNLSVGGNSDLTGNGTGTTKVHNLEISGSVTGLTINLSQDNISVASLVSFGNVTAGGDLIVSGNTVVGKTTIGFAQFVEEEVVSSTASWSPTGNANIYNVTVDEVLTIGMWPGLTDADKPAPFQAVIYLWQDAVGRAVTFDGSYKALNTETVNPAPNSVTIVNLSYCGRGEVVDMIISRRT